MDEQIIDILKEACAGAVVLDLCRKHGMSSAKFYAWKSIYGGLELSEAKRLPGLEVMWWTTFSPDADRGLVVEWTTYRSQPWAT